MSVGFTDMEYGALLAGMTTAEYAQVFESVTQAFADPRPLSADIAPYRTDVCPVCGRTVEIRDLDVTAGQWICHVTAPWFGEGIAG